MEYEYRRTEDPVHSPVGDAKKGEAAMGLARTAIPTGTLALGAVGSLPSCGRKRGERKKVRKRGFDAVTFRKALPGLK